MSLLRSKDKRWSSKTEEKKRFSRRTFHLLAHFVVVIITFFRTQKCARSSAEGEREKETRQSKNLLSPVYDLKARHTAHPKMLLTTKMIRFDFILSLSHRVCDSLSHLSLSLCEFIFVQFTRPIRRKTNKSIKWREPKTRWCDRRWCASRMQFRVRMNEKKREECRSVCMYTQNDMSFASATTTSGRQWQWRQSKQFVYTKSN